MKLSNKQTGCYQLILYLKKEQRIKIGKLGNFDFPSGHYIYSGSQQKHILPRIKRHLRKDKKLHWHIDYFLANSNVNIENILIYPNRAYECGINQKLGEQIGGYYFPLKFGAGDCKQNCSGHLIFTEKLSKEKLKDWTSENSSVWFFK